MAVRIPGSGGSGGSGAVDSVFGRTGNVTAVAGDYAVADVTGAAPLASPTFTGTPAAPTAGVGTNTTQIATTAFVNAEPAKGLKSATTTVSISAATAPSASQVLTATNSTTATWQDPAVPSARTITAGSALSGGGDLSANRTIDLDITELTQDYTPDSAADFLAVYDTSATANKKATHADFEASARHRSFWGWQKTRGAASTNVIGGTATTNSGTLAEVFDARGEWLSFTSAATTGSLAAATQGGTGQECQPRFEPDWTFVFSYPNQTNFWLWVGMFVSASAANLDQDDPGTAAIAVRFSTATDTNFQLITDDGTNPATVTDTGVVPAHSTTYVVRLRYTGSLVECWVNGTRVTTTSTIAADTTSFGTTVAIVTSENVEKAIYAKRVEGTQL